MKIEHSDLDSQPPPTSFEALADPRPIDPMSQQGCGTPAPSPKQAGWLDWRLWCLLALAALSVQVWRMLAPAHARPLGETSPLPTVPVCGVTRETLFNELTIPAEFRPYNEVQIHAKVSGYVRDMYVDFGDRVTNGQLLATLEVPELTNDLDRAIGARKKAEADHADADLFYHRMVDVNKQTPNLITQQDVDTAEAKDQSTEAALAAARAEEGRYRTLLDYTRITARFDGVITARYADPSDLIQMGTTSDTQAKPVVQVSDNYLLRLDFFVSVAYVKDIHTNDWVDVFVESLGNRRLKGRITRFTYRVAKATRTMETEVEVPNPNLEIKPGMYANVVLKVQQRPNTLSVPTLAIAGGKNTVYLVDSNNVIEERPVTLGLETPYRREVTSGLREGDMVMWGERTQVEPGQKVSPVPQTPPVYEASE